MKKICLVLLILISIKNFAQTKTKSYKMGQFIFQQYKKNIFKITYTPYDYIRNENITNAIIAQPEIVNAKVSLARGSKIPARIDFPNGRFRITNTKIDLLENNFFGLIDIFKDGIYNGFSFKLSDDEKIYGGGERALPLSRRGHRFNIYNAPAYGYEEGAENLNFSVPFFSSSKNYALLFDNGSKGFADIGKSDGSKFTVAFEGGELNFFLILGNQQEILSSFHLITGLQPMPPRWVFGNLMSRFGYRSSKEVSEITSAMQKEGIPFDAIIYDLFWFGDSLKGTMGNLDWTSKASWPTPRKTMQEFKSKNINSILIAEPFVVKGTKNYTSFSKFFAKDKQGEAYNIEDFYFGEAGLIDIFRKDAQDTIWKEFYKKQIDTGVTGWWTDLGEPEKHPEGIYHNLKDQGVSRLVEANEVHNIFGHYWNKMLYDKYVKEMPNHRLFHLNRSGFAGSQRFSVFPWSGDVHRNWSGLRAQLSVMLGMSMCGIPYIHADAGGFALGDGDNELYVRWLQFACFTPVFRPHGTALYDLEENTFSFPSEPALIDQPYRDIAKKTVLLRYSLLPYNYSLAYQNSMFAKPLVAPFYYHFENEPDISKVENQFMWGENIMIAPIVEKGQTEKTVALPKGQWYEFGKNKTLENSFTSKFELDEIPLFVKAGSFIPTFNMPTNSNVKTTKDLKNLTVAYYFSNQKSNYKLYEDDGESANAITKGNYELTQFSAESISEKELHIIIKSNKGNYKGKQKNRIIMLDINGLDSKIGKVEINDKPFSDKTFEDGKIPVFFDGNYTLIKIKID